MIFIESVDYTNSVVTITDGKRSKEVPVEQDGSISRLAPGIEVEMTFEQFAQMFFCPKYEFYTPTTALACVGYYGEASEPKD